MKISISGGDLTDKEKKIINAVLNSDKTSKHIHDVDFKIKEYTKGGLRHKVVANLEANTDFGKIHANSDSWRFNIAIKNISKKLFKQIRRSTPIKKESMRNKFVRNFKKPFDRK